MKVQSTMSDNLMPKHCLNVKAAEAYRGKQGLEYFAGVSAQTVGSRGICMHLLTVPPGGRAKAHKHLGHETTIYVLSGEGHTLFGNNLENVILSRAGDIVYIPAGVPHLPVNLGTEPLSGVVARTDPNEQESVVLLPELELVAEAIIAKLKRGEIKIDEGGAMDSC